jgi:hypothetical protein
MYLPGKEVAVLLIGYIDYYNEQEGAASEE